eukprot:15470530-Alexandrium_andersonii.AAC.1
MGLEGPPIGSRLRKAFRGDPRNQRRQPVARLIVGPVSGGCWKDGGGLGIGSTQHGCQYAPKRV